MPYISMQCDAIVDSFNLSHKDKESILTKTKVWKQISWDLKMILKCRGSNNQLPPPPQKIRPSTLPAEL